MIIVAKQYLNERQKETVFQMAADGHTVKEIAEAIGKWESTVAGCIERNVFRIREMKGLMPDGTPMATREPGARGSRNEWPVDSGQSPVTENGGTSGECAERTGEAEETEAFAPADTERGKIVSGEPEKATIDEPGLPETETAADVPQGAAAFSPGQLPAKEEADRRGNTAEADPEDGVTRAMSRDEWDRIRLATLAFEIIGCVKKRLVIRREVFLEYDEIAERFVGE